MSTEHKKEASTDVPKFNIQPMAGSKSCDEKKARLLELQLKMATSSINHEYARMEFDDTEDRERREDLLEFMDDCRCQYFEARVFLEAHDPYALEDFEADLLRQKQTAIAQYNA